MRQIATNQQTGLLRLAVILLPTALLAACGGGGGGGAAAPVLPPVVTEIPPAFLISEIQAADARTQIGGTLPNPLPSPSDLAEQVVNIAQVSDALSFKEVADGAGINANRTIICTPGTTMCTATIDDGQGGGPQMQMQAIDDIDGPVLFDNGEGHAGYNGRYAFVMTNRDVPLVQARAAGRLEGVRYEYQGYGGWLDHSVFIVQRQTAMISNEEISFFSAYSFGNASGRNPTRNAKWNGVMVGVVKDGGDIVQGDATLQWDQGTPNVVGGLFNNIKNLTEGVDFTEPLMTLNSIPLVGGGRFESDDAFLVGSGSIHGNFYGDNLEEAGGVFDTESIIGAFGGRADTPQP